jgi:hypothetical protein
MIFDQQWLCFCVDKRHLSLRIADEVSPVLQQTVQLRFSYSAFLEQRTLRKPLGKLWLMPFPHPQCFCDRMLFDDFVRSLASDTCLYSSHEYPPPQRLQTGGPEAPDPGKPLTL